MCSIPGLPTLGSNVTILITGVNLHPLCAPVEIWGTFNQTRKLEYQHMRRAIQSPNEIFHESEGNPGDSCLVQSNETWYRARIVSINGPNYTVFLIDQGITLNASNRALAWGHKDFFLLPPEVEFCILTNVWPLLENSWCPMALEFLQSFCGRTVNGRVQDVLMLQRTFLLDIPCISKPMCDMGFAKKLSIENFNFFLARSLQSLREEVVVTDSEQISSTKAEPVEVHSEVEKWQCYLYPELPPETVESVIVTEVTNPLRIFCQLKVFSEELKKLTEQITQHFEGRPSTRKAIPERFGSPCASRGSDGKWYRSVLQQIFPANNTAEVLHVDYGTTDVVELENVRPLAAEFLRMPVVTYVCSLHGVIDKGVGWTTAQIDYLKFLLIDQPMIAIFEYQSWSEGVHYVTLYENENVNINSLFVNAEEYLLEPEESCEVVSHKCPGPHNVTEEIQTAFGTESLPLNSSHLSVVRHVDSPSEFWIQTQQHSHEFDQLMCAIGDLYDNSAGEEGLVRNPTVDLFCAARSQDNAFERATVREVIGKQAKVHFVDCGNTEVVDCSNLRVLPETYQALPALALKCSLTGIRPQGNKWSQSAITFFSKAVEGRLLDLHVSAKGDGKYLVQLTDASPCGESNIGKLLCSAGFAEPEDIGKQVSWPEKKNLSLPTMQVSSEKYSDVDTMNTSGAQALFTNIPIATETGYAFKENLFPIGNSVDVNVSCIESPNDFWCQIAQNSRSLNSLMQDIQHYYVDREIQQPVEAACVARHPVNRMWYRALIVQEHTTPHVDVLFIDYGKTEKVPIQDLQPIHPTFLKPEGQAFRCSLYNLIHPAGHFFLEWSDAATSKFRDIVDTAASVHVDLKCTIYAVMYNSQKVVYSVDLETPFQSVSSLLVQKGLADCAPPKIVSLPLFRLDTYYYSTHDIKAGGEEIYITNVKSADLFYCQLEKNSDLIQELSEEVNDLCRQLQCISCPPIFDTVCFAKCSDGLWYRGQIESTHPVIEVHFVDYGVTLEVDKSDLLPIPINASEIMSVPVQAVECGLANMPTDVSSDVNRWFESNATYESFTASVVTTEPCGKLMVELYDGKLQVNSKVKERVHIEAQKKENVSFERCDARSQYRKDPSVKHTENYKTSDEHKPKLATQMFEDNGKTEKLKLFQDNDISFRQGQENVKKLNHDGSYWEPEEFRRKVGKSENLEKRNISFSDSKHEEAPTRKAQDEYGGVSYPTPKGKEQRFPKLKENTLSPSDHKEDSDASFNLASVAHSISEITYSTGNSKDMLCCTREVLEESIEIDSEVTNTAELAAASSEELPDVNSVCLAMSKQEDCETEICTSETFRALEETGKKITPFDGRSTSIKVQACMLDQTNPLFYMVDESSDELLALHGDQCPDARTDSDIYEAQCTGPSPQDMRPGSSLSDEIFRKENVQGDHLSRPESELGKLKLAELFVGSDCVVWSYAHSRWCRGRIAKISEDRVKLLLLEHSAEAVMGLQNIIERCPETPVQDPVADTFSSDGGSQPVQDNKPGERPERGAVLPPEADSEEMAQGKAAARATDVKSCDQDSGTDEKEEDRVNTIPVFSSGDVVQCETNTSTCAAPGYLFEEQTSRETRFTRKYPGNRFKRSGLTRKSHPRI